MIFCLSVTGASGYWLQVATDVAFNCLLVSRDGQPPRFTFQVTRQGRYLALKLKRVSDNKWWQIWK